jgi:cell wall-associated NlpC family hydrolase
VTRLSVPGALLLAVVCVGPLAAQGPSTVTTTTSASAATAPPAPFAVMSASANAMRDSIVALARAQLGTRYVWGGTNPDRGFDCSGLIRYIAQKLKLDVPRTANAQSHVGRAVVRDTARLRPGDLLTFGNGKSVSHIGIYVGDGKFIHASTAAGRVIESKLDRKPSRGIKAWKGVRRLFADADSSDRPAGG